MLWVRISISHPSPNCVTPDLGQNYNIYMKHENVDHFSVMIFIQWLCFVPLREAHLIKKTKWNKKNPKKYVLIFAWFCQEVICCYGFVFLLLCMYSLSTWLHKINAPNLPRSLCLGKLLLHCFSYSSVRNFIYELKKSSNMLNVFKVEYVPESNRVFAKLVTHILSFYFSVLVLSWHGRIYVLHSQVCSN